MHWPALAVMLHECSIASACKERLNERGATEDEVIVTIETGETFPAKFGRTGFRRNFAFGERWKGKVYATKQVEVYAVKEDEDWLAITCDPIFLEGDRDEIDL